VVVVIPACDRIAKAVSQSDTDAPHIPPFENDPAPPCHSTAFPFRATELVTDQNIAPIDRPDVSRIAMSDGIPQCHQKSCRVEPVKVHERSVPGNFDDLFSLNPLSRDDTPWLV
jgi:hypothetical protein